MIVAIRGGAVLGLLVTLWMFFMGFAGWYKHPVLLFAFWLVVPLQMAVLIWSLGKTADRRGYIAQAGLGLAISALGGIIIFFASLLFTTVAFPRYFQEIRALQESLLRQAGKSEPEIRSLLELASRDATPVGQALAGLIGTLATGLIASVVIAAFARRRDPARSP
jgi:hypothetical protein